MITIKNLHSAISNLGYDVTRVDIIGHETYKTWVAEARYDTENNMIKEGASLWIFAFGDTEELALEKLLVRIARERDMLDEETEC